MHQFGWLSEGGVNVLKLLQKEGGAQKGGGEVQPWYISSNCGPL